MKRVQFNFVRLYDDVVPLLRMLASDGIRTFSSSANSVDSQKTLFGFSNHGDVNEVRIFHRFIYKRGAYFSLVHL